MKPNEEAGAAGSLPRVLKFHGRIGGAALGVVLLMVGGLLFAGLLAFEIYTGGFEPHQLQHEVRARNYFLTFFGVMAVTGALVLVLGRPVVVVDARSRILTSRHGFLPYFRRKEVLSFEDVLAVGLMTAEIPAGDHAAEVPVVALRLSDGSWRPLGPPAGWRGFLGSMWSREAARKTAKELAAFLGVPFEWK